MLIYKKNRKLKVYCLAIGLAILFTTANSKLPDSDAKFTNEEEGSAVFNVLFVIGACSLAAPSNLPLT